MPDQPQRHASTTDRPVVTRFAPSPTGLLHVGGARTALYSYALAKRHGGKFILRFEDTDLARSSKESADAILRDLQWLGLSWDAGPDIGDPQNIVGGIGAAMFCQSKRHEAGVYDQYIKLLLDDGIAYEDGDAVRFRQTSDITFDDAVYGTVNVAASELEDFIIRKGEAGGRMPTFHFAVVIDDALMGVTHIVRGQEHLTNTTKHAALYDALRRITGDAKFARPVWAHTPSIMNPDGSKMSKRDKAKAARKAAKETGLDHVDHPDITRSLFDEFMAKANDSLVVADAIANDIGIKLPEINVADFRRSGYLPETLLNYLALLGWNPGDDVEHFDLDFICENFSFDRVNKANSKFDRDKLKAFNAKRLRELEKLEFVQRLWQYCKKHDRRAISMWRRFPDQDAVPEKFPGFAEMYQGRCETFPDAFTNGASLLKGNKDITYDFTPKPIRKAMKSNDNAGAAMLRDLRDAFAKLPEDGFGQAGHELIAKLAQERGLNMGKLAQPIRVAVSGGVVTPEIDKTLEFLGKESTLERIDNCLEAFEAHLAST